MFPPAVLVLARTIAISAAGADSGGRLPQANNGTDLYRVDVWSRIRTGYSRVISSVLYPMSYPLTGTWGFEPRAYA